MMYVWLKPGTDTDALSKLGLGDYRLSEARNEKECSILMLEDPCDPTEVIPEIPSQLVDRVTIKEYIPVGHKQLTGAYQVGDTTLLVKSEVKRFGEMGLPVWTIRLNAKSIKEAVAVYISLRRGTIDHSNQQYWAI